MTQSDDNSEIREILARAGWVVPLTDELRSRELFSQTLTELLGALRAAKTHVLRGAAALPSTTAHRGLANWQMNRVMRHIEINIESTIHMDQLAGLARLSTYHFCRSFRDTFGSPPHRYIMQRRIERAKTLMMTSKAPLGQIAIDCGMADQAHFNKSFRRFVGESPGVWRRAQSLE